MQSQVTSSQILVGDLRQQILSIFQVNERLAAQLPLEKVEIYSAGFRAALTAIATAYDLNIPELREAELTFTRKLKQPSRHDMRL